MRIALTGASGVIGSHTAAAVAAAGHDLILLARGRSRLESALAPFSIETWDCIEGDLNDSGVIEEFLKGADALIHCAALVSFRHRRRKEMEQTNVTATEALLLSAAHRGLDPIVHVSSISALARNRASKEIRETAEVAVSHDPYGATKSAAESIARSLQRDGLPITITYPGAVVGPDVPLFQSSARSLFDQVQVGWVPLMPSGVPIVDVRDLARLHAVLLEPGAGPRRYLWGGHFVSYGKLTEHFEQLTGRAIRRLRAPGALIRGIGFGRDVIDRLFDVDGGAFTHEMMNLATRGVPCDNSRALSDFGLKARSLEQTLRDTVLWMYTQGLLSAEHLGKLAGQSR